MLLLRTFAGFLLLIGLSSGQTATPNPAEETKSEDQKIEPVKSSITVTEHVYLETPTAVTLLTSEQLSDTPGVNLDDRLRHVPGFSLFRRNSSLIANPTTQGISLRGIGSSGASRTLVLFDGVPLNDPFGGWVYWTRFTPEDITRVEVSRGASTSVFGNLALGGAINIFPNEPVPNTRHVSAGAEVGSQDTYDLWAGYTQSFRHFAVTAGGRGLTTDGYYVVPGYARGAVDRHANVRFVNDSVRLDGFWGQHRLYAWINTLVEERGNGTYLTKNSTTIGTAALRYSYQSAHDVISVTGFGSSGQYHATFSSVTNNRNTERLTDRQTVPEDQLGGAGIWTHSASWFNLNVGADAERDHGVSTDRFSPTNIRVAGGTVVRNGEFIQTDFNARGVRFFVGGRHQYTGQGNQFFNPSAGISAGAGRWRFRGSAYRAFRSPTLNELFRQFSAGNTLTLANPDLQPETLLGAEVGVDYVTERGSIQLTAFRNDLHNLVTNVTLLSSPSQILRQRQNAANVIDRGFEVSARQAWGDWSGQASYLYAESRYNNTGLRVAQVPKSQGTATLTWSRGRTLASAGVRAYSYQFDDDLNTFRLPGFAVAELLVRQQLAPRTWATFEMTNALDHLIYTGFTPTPTIGDPRQVRGGLLFRWN
jgi:outer membrane cobalamin receptor